MADSFRDYIIEVMNKYVQAKKETFSGHPIGEILRSSIPTKLYSTIGNDFLIRGSSGQGVWANVPWIAIMDRNETTTTTKGVYVVYLFSEDMKRIYLTLNQGVTQLIKDHGTTKAEEIFNNNIKEIRNKYPAPNFVADNNIKLASSGLGSSYEKSTIYYKEYNIHNMPSEEELFSDLKEILEVYKNYLGQEVTINLEVSELKEKSVDFNSLLLNKKQIILYGPPGTGKTFNTKKVVMSLIGGK